MELLSLLLTDEDEDESAERPLLSPPPDDAAATAPPGEEPHRGDGCCVVCVGLSLISPLEQGLDMADWRSGVEEEETTDESARGGDDIASLRSRLPPRVIPDVRGREPCEE